MNDDAKIETPEPCRYCGAQIGRAEELLRRAAKVVETSPETPIFAAELTAAAEELAALTRPAGGEEVEVTDEMLNAGQERLCQIRAPTDFDDEAQAEIFKAMYAARIRALSSLPVRSGEAERLREALARCETVFGQYAEMHRAKLPAAEAYDPRGAMEIADKVQRNVDMADLCRAALATPRPVP